MQRPRFIDQIRSKWNENKFVCVGLDADIDKLPESLNSLSITDKVFYFNQSIIDATHDVIAAYKPNVAFYEELGPEGWEALIKTVAYIHEKYPDIPVILDAKRADIGNTNKKYAQMAFELVKADAVTLNVQYFGSDSLAPFEEYPERGLIIIAKSSNLGSPELQDMPIDLKEAFGQSLLTKDEFDKLTEVSEFQNRNPRVYEIVAYMAAKRWNKFGNIGLVVGAAHPETFQTIRKIAGDLPLLIPGIGTQGGDLQQTLQVAPDSQQQGMIISSSSGIIYASKGKDFAKAARKKTLELHHQINEYRQAA